MTQHQISKKHPNVIFLSSLKGGSSASSCVAWADSYEANGAVDMLGVDTAGLTINDDSAAMRDVFFTSPFPHPSYIIIDPHGKVRAKFVGPCCGYASYGSCTTNTALGSVYKCSQAYYHFARCYVPRSKWSLRYRDRFVS